MSEPDHIIVKPIPNLAKQDLAAAFPFFYIEPIKYESVLRKYFPEDKGKVTDIDPIGNSPVIIEKVTTLMPQVPRYCIFGIQCLYTSSSVFRLLWLRLLLHG